MTDTAVATDPKKAAVWFKKGLDCVGLKNWDYSVSSYVMGLQFDPDNLDMVQQLIKVGRMRKAAGGKRGDGMFGEKFSVNGKGPLVPLMQALESLAKDPDNNAKWEKAVRASTEAGVPKVAEWLGDQYLSLVRAETGSSRKTKFNMLKDHYKSLELFNKAQLACGEALRLDPNNLELTTEMKNLAAQQTTKRGGFEDALTEGSDFRKSIKDIDKQMKGLRDGADVKTDEHIAVRVGEAKAKWEREPQHTGLLGAYITALLSKESDANENTAIQTLEQVYAKTNEYALRIRAGDIRSKQMRRKLRELKEKVNDPAIDEAEKAKLQAVYVTQAKQLLNYEIKEFRERAEKYPSDREIRYELGHRCLDAGLVDEAIDNLQQAEGAPKVRIKALNHLGMAFNKKGWFEEAADSFKRALESYELENDDTSKNLRYNLGVALEALGQPEEAVKEYSTVARWQMTFKDVRDRLQRLRQASRKPTP